MFNIYDDKYAKYHKCLAQGKNKAWDEIIVFITKA